MRIRTALCLAGAGYAGYRLAIKPWWDGWGVDPEEAGAPLAGDDLVLAPDHVQTRGIDIAAPPEAVWPWLVQMGYGRGGWYSYDRIDMDAGSVTEIAPDLQHLAVGDVVPTHPGGGFLVREVDPGRALVLYLDDGIIAAQAKAARARRAGATPANLQASGAFISAGVGSRFVASWAFVLVPRPAGTRLVERFRIAMPESGAGSRLAGPFIGFGTFLMLRKQLLGIRERVERAMGASVPAAADNPPAVVVAGPAEVAGSPEHVEPTPVATPA